MNILIDGTPQNWNGYRVNTDFRVGIRVMQAAEDRELYDNERFEIIMRLLFQNEDGTMREHPPADDMGDVLKWFLSGWNHDKTPQEKQKRKTVDFEVDQWRIYADFLQSYGIDLGTAKMHFWAFCGLLWNLPARSSSFMQVVDIRQRKINPKASAAEKKAITDAQKVYGLEQPEETKELTTEEIAKIDAFDRLRKGTGDGGRNNND